MKNSLPNDTFQATLVACPSNSLRTSTKIISSLEKKRNYRRAKIPKARKKNKYPRIHKQSGAINIKPCRASLLSISSVQYSAPASRHRASAVLDRKYPSPSSLSLLLSFFLSPLYTRIARLFLENRVGQVTTAGRDIM